MPLTYSDSEAVMEVGALIFVLGIDLVKEAVWDTRNRASKSEYITIFGMLHSRSAYSSFIDKYVLQGIMFCMTLVRVFEYLDRKAPN